jgi:hypothetical protein
MPAVSKPARLRRGHIVGAVMNDLLVIALTIVIFAALFLLVKVVEHIER